MVGVVDTHDTKGTGMPRQRLTSRPVTSLAGKLIVFEGADGAGKTTLIQAIFDSLREVGVKVERLAFPGAEAGTIGRLVYDIHHQPESFGVGAITPASLQTLHVAAHIDAIQTTSPSFRRLRSPRPLLVVDLGLRDCRSRARPNPPPAYPVRTCCLGGDPACDDHSPCAAWR